MQAEDNGYYLKLDENGEYAVWGCYYAHCENEIGGRDKLDKNTTIFGHSASNCDPDGPKFTKLYRYMDADFVKEHPYIYFSEEDTVLTLSTCCRKYDNANTGNQRLVVMAKLLPEGATAQEFSVSLAENPEMP